MNSNFETRNQKKPLSLNSTKRTKKIFYLIALIVLTLGCWLTLISYFGSTSFGVLIGLLPVWLIVFAAASWFFTKGLVFSAKKVNFKAWLLGGFLILTVWFLPASSFLKLFPNQREEPFSTPLAFTLLVPISLSFIILAFLINTGVGQHIRWRIAEIAYYRNTKTDSKHTEKVVAVIVVLSALLLLGALYKFYWFMVWDSTYDGLGYLWLPIPILAILSSSIMLFIALPNGTKLAALFYLLLIPILIAVSTHTQRVDFRQLTEKRATQISQAIDAYYVREGHYPEELQQLTLRYMIAIPRPVIIYGQNWCYDGGTDYYRLGYLDREHWSSPNLIGQTSRTWGKIPDLPIICEPEAAAFMAQFPSPFWTFNE